MKVDLLVLVHNNNNENKNIIYVQIAPVWSHQGLVSMHVREFLVDFFVLFYSTNIGGIQGHGARSGSKRCLFKK